MENKKTYNLKKSKFDTKKNKNIYLYMIFKIIIFFSIFQKYNLISSFLYPKAIKLVNENIFIIHKQGIDIYDSSITNKIKSIITFREEDKIKNNDIYNKITISNFNESTYECLFTIINDKIYIFNSEGDILYNSHNKISLFNVDYYSLIPIKKIGNKYYYMISFINENNFIQLLLFEYDNKNHQNIILSNKSAFNYTVINKRTFIIKNNGLSCQLMNNSSKSDIIVCFFCINSFKNFLTNSFIILDNSSFIIKNTNNTINLPNEINEIKIIKSITNIENSKIFIYIIIS
jgi:hypothetical protein